MRMREGEQGGARPAFCWTSFGYTKLPGKCPVGGRACGVGGWPCIVRGVGVLCIGEVWMQNCECGDAALLRTFEVRNHTSVRYRSYDEPCESAFSCAVMAYQACHSCSRGGDALLVSHSFLARSAPTTDRLRPRSPDRPSGTKVRSESGTSQHPALDP